MLNSLPVCLSGHKKTTQEGGRKVIRKRFVMGRTDSSAGTTRIPDLDRDQRRIPVIGGILTFV